MTYNFNLRFSPASIFLITNILVYKVSLPCSFHCFLQKRTICLFHGRHGWKNHNRIERTALKPKKNVMGGKITIELKELH
jgi:hypothetical protein